MKKNIFKAFVSVLIVMAIATSITMNGKKENVGNNQNLASLISVAIADDGEMTPAYGCWYTGNWWSVCSSGWTDVHQCMPSSMTTCGY